MFRSLHRSWVDFRYMVEVPAREPVDPRTALRTCRYQRTCICAVECVRNRFITNTSRISSFTVWIMGCELGVKVMEVGFITVWNIFKIVMRYALRFTLFALKKFLFYFTITASPLCLVNYYANYEIKTV